MSKKLEFHAAVVSVDELDGAYVVGFADDRMAPSQYILLQRAIEEDEQDAELGMNTYFLEICDSGTSGYGGIRKVTLKQNTLAIDMRQPSAYAGEIEEVVVHFHLQGRAMAGLASQLELIFQDSDCTLEVSKPL